MKVNQIYVNLPVKDIQQTKDFWLKLDFEINEQFSDEKAVCVVMNDNIFVMFLTEEYFQTSQKDLRQKAIQRRFWLQLV